MRADLGASLSSGQVVAILDSVELGRARADFLSARADLKVAEAELVRKEALLTKKIASEAEALAAFRAFNYERIYLRPEAVVQADLSAQLIASLAEFYVVNPGRLPEEVFWVLFCGRAGGGRSAPPGVPARESFLGILGYLIKWLNPHSLGPLGAQGFLLPQSPGVHQMVSFKIPRSFKI